MNGFVLYTNRLRVVKAMKEGTVSLRLIKCLCQGPPRVGKTHIKHLLLGKVLVDSSSTGLGVHPECAFRNISTEKYKADKSRKTWEVMDYNKLMQLIANEMSQLKVEKQKIDGNNKTDYAVITKIRHKRLLHKRLLQSLKALCQIMYPHIPLQVTKNGYTLLILVVSHNFRRSFKHLSQKHQSSSLFLS